MTKNNFEISQGVDHELVQTNFLNDLIIVLPAAGFRIELSTPLFDIEAFSPAEIILNALTPDEFEVQIITPLANLITLVPSLVLEVFNPEGVRIIRIVAPPEE